MKTRRGPSPLSKRTTAIAVIAAALAAVTTGAARAAEEPPRPAGTYTACRSDDAARLGFLTERLDARRRYATYYYRGWISFYTVGAGVSTYDAVKKQDNGKQAVHALSAAMAVFGIARFLYAPPGAKDGADGIAVAPIANAEACAAEVGLAEERLRENAHEATRRWRWKSHLFNLALHVTGAVVVGEGWDAREEAWTSAAIGEAVGEAVIWSFPWHADGDLAEYEQRFPRSGVSAAPPLAWSILPTSSGAAIELRF